MNEQVRPQAEPTEAKSLAAPLPAKHSFLPLRECKTLEQAFNTHEFMERIQASVPQHVQPGRMLRTFVSAVSKTPLLAQVSMRSFLGACLTCSQVGLEPNTPLGHIWLLPFKAKAYNPATRKRDLEVVEVNTIFGYPGLLDLSYRTTKVKSIHADVVWPGDEFSFEYGSDAHIRHRPRAHKPSDVPLYAYMHAALDGGQAFEVMPYDDVLAIRNKSQAYRFALSLKEKGQENGGYIPRGWTDAPWVAHEIAMARKTAFRSGSKWLPRSVELAAAIAIDEAQDRRTRMDFSTVMDAPTIDGTPDYIGAAADAAGQSDEENEALAETLREREAAGRTQVQVSTPGPSDAEAAARKQQLADDQRAAQARATASRQAEMVQQEAQQREQKRQQDDADERARQQAGDRARVERDLAGAGAGQPNWDDPAAYVRGDERAGPAGGFEAALIDAAGELVSEPFSDPVAFAGAFLELWNGLDGQMRQALREYNEDALIDAAGDPAASAVLARMHAPAAVRQNVEPAIVAVVPPSDRGKLSWPGYVKALKADLVERTTAANFAPWAAAQRAALEACPVSQRVLAIRAISEAAGRHRVEQPPWLADLIKAKAAAAPASGDAPGDAPGKSADERWVDAQEGALAAMEGAAGRIAFTELIGSGAVKTIMARLRRDDRVLFDRADQQFTAKHHELPKVVEGGV